jgi:hypothetical protein
VCACACACAHATYHKRSTAGTQRVLRVLRVLSVGALGTQSTHREPSSVVGVSGVRVDGAGPAAATQRAAMHRSAVATRYSSVAAHYSAVATPPGALQRLRYGATWRARLRRGEVRGERQRQRRVEGVVPEGTRQYSSVLWVLCGCSGYYGVLFGTLGYSAVLWGTLGYSPLFGREGLLHALALDGGRRHGAAVQPEAAARTGSTAEYYEY